jgi:hypothetical protein
VSLQFLGLSAESRRATENSWPYNTNETPMPALCVDITALHGAWVPLSAEALLMCNVALLTEQEVGNIGRPPAPWA